MAEFGNMFVPAVLEDGVTDLLQKFFPYYLRELEDRMDMKVGTLDVPTNYKNRNRFENTPGEALPRVLVIAPGLVGPPIKNGRGVYQAVYRVGVAVVCVAPDEDTARLYANLYGVSVRSILIDHPSVEGLALATDWVDESFNEVPVGDQNRNFRSAIEWFAIQIANVATKGSGPQDVPERDILGIASEVEIDLGRS